MRRKQSIDQGRVDCRRYQLLRNSCVSFIGKIWHTAIGTAAERYLCHNGKLCYCLAVSQTQKKGNSNETHLCGSANTNFLSLRSRRTIPCSWQAATVSAICLNSLRASCSRSLFRALT